MARDFCFGQSQGTKNYQFETPLQEFQFLDKYSRFNFKESRFETWPETVNRTVEFLIDLSNHKLSKDTYLLIRESILNMDVMPSMRLLRMAGEAAKHNSILTINCSYLPIDNLECFVEILIIIMNGCGVGFSVERDYIKKLPEIQKQEKSLKPSIHIVEDSTEGWANAIRSGLQAWFAGKDLIFNYSLIRPAGSILFTKGGTASGPNVLSNILDKIKGIILSKQGSTLRPIDVFDIICFIGNATVLGGVRRTAMICIFDYDDIEMLSSKSGNFDKKNSQRWNANISAVFPDRHLSLEEISEFIYYMDSTQRGEPGIFNRRSALITKPQRRVPFDFGTNSCGEFILRPYEFCNISSIVCRGNDSLTSLSQKAEIASIIGTIQACGNEFPNLRGIWKTNTTEERLLGVNLNGQWDNE